MVIKGNVEVKLPAIWTDEKQRWEGTQKKVRRGKKKINEEEVRESPKKEDAGVLNTVFFQ